MSIQQWQITEPYLEIPCKLGEGVFYNEERHEIRFLDINSSKLYLINLNEGPQSVREIDTGVPIGVTVDIEGVDSSRMVLAGAKDGVTKFDLTTGQHSYVAKYWSGVESEDKTRRMRSNDGAVDSAGRLWIEAFVDPELSDLTDEGVLFRLDPDGTLKTMYEKMVIPNGISWNAEDNTLFLTDTTVGKIWSFTYDRETGNLSERKTFYHHEGPGNPDGHTMDEQGNIWQALYGGSKVLRISPQGEITDLFITSAKEEQPEKYPESAKFAGNLFKINVGIRGAPKHKARLP